jgi:hypothetical protein
MTESPGVLATFPGWDAAYIPSTLPAGYAGVYVGGSSAFRVATDADLARVARCLVLPIWVPTPQLDNPRQVAFQAAERLEQLGIPRYARPYRALMVDLETWDDPLWLEAFAARFISQGYDTIPYGSPGSVFRQPQRLGYAVASPTGNPHMYQHPGVIITQYAWDLTAPGGTLYDADLAVMWLANHLGPLTGKFLRDVQLDARPADDDTLPPPVPGLPVPEPAAPAEAEATEERGPFEPLAPQAPAARPMGATPTYDSVAAALGPGRMMPAGPADPYTPPLPPRVP